MEWLSPTEYLSSDPWDVFFQILLLFILFVMSVRYVKTENGFDIKSGILVGMITPVIYYCVYVFAVGTAEGTGLKHPFLVILYIIGGAIVIYTVDSIVKILDSWLVNRKK